MPEPFDQPPVDYVNWLEKVKAELKGRPLADFEYNWDGLRISPFEIPAVAPELVSRRTENSWKIGSYVEPSGDQANLDLLTALNEGAAAIGMDIKNHPDWNHLFKKVHLDWISLNLNFSQSKEVTSWREYLRASGQKTKGTIRIADAETIEVYRMLQDIGGFRLLNYELKELDHRHALARIFYQLTQDISILSKEYDPIRVLSHVALYVRGQNDLMLNISMIRAIRLLWKHLMSSAGYESGYPEIYIIAHIPQPLPIATGTQSQYIRSSLLAISMILGGIDELFIEHAALSDDHGRYGRMIQHIYEQEAHLGEIPDPLSGSRVLEYLTGLIVQRVWNETILLEQVKK